MHHWRFISSSVAGTSHVQSGIPCQDHSVASVLALDGETVILVAADGAGSALYSHVGSEWACRTLLGEISDFLAQGGKLDSVSHETVDEWCLNVHACLADQARELEVGSRDLACTLLCAIGGEATSVFFQVGDGAIVIGRDDAYSPVFWPQSGEYANTTFFISDPEALTRLQYTFLAEPISEIALFSDGLQLLALNYAKKEAHTPFFLPMFKRLRQEAGGRAEQLEPELTAYLDSPVINGRTDDDKTLILATRQSPEDSTQV